MASQASVRAAVGNGRYSLHREFAVGGMASVHLARQKGAGGFQRVVAVKKLHAHFARDPGFAAMFLDEARMVARIRHPNVVPVIDVVADADELLLVMEYVHGETLARLMQREREADRTIPADIAAAIMAGALHGLHAAHEATDENGRPMNIVHRDVSPHNLLVGIDGVARVLDFGVAKSNNRAHHTEEGQIKGKVAYMAPEQLDSAPVSRRTDVFAAGVILWELVTGRRMIEGPSPVHQAIRVLNQAPVPPSSIVPGVPARLDAIVLRALQRDPAKRFATARDMATAIEFAVRAASPRAVGDYVAATASDALTRRARMIREVEGSSNGGGRLMSLVSIPDDDVFEVADPSSKAAAPESIVPAANTVAPPRIGSSSLGGGRRSRPVRSFWSAFAVLLLSTIAMSPVFVRDRPGASSAPPADLSSTSRANATIPEAGEMASASSSSSDTLASSVSSPAIASGSASAQASAQSLPTVAAQPTTARRARKRPSPVAPEQVDWPPPE